MDLVLVFEMLWKVCARNALAASVTARLARIAEIAANTAAAIAPAAIIKLIFCSVGRADQKFMVESNI